MPLGLLDSAILVFGLISAVVLYILRRWRHRVSTPGQFLIDWLGVWTIIELVLIGIASLNRGVLALFGLHPPDPADIIKSNGLLLPIAIIYCAGLVAKNTIAATWDALVDPDKGNPARKDIG